MAYAFVQDASGYTASAALTLDVAFGSNVTAGTTLIAVVIGDGSYTVTLSDTVGSNDTWIAIGALNRDYSGQRLLAYYLKNAAAGACTVRATVGSTTSNAAMYIAEVSGLGWLDRETSALSVAPGTGADAISSGTTATLNNQPALVLGVSFNSSDLTDDPSAGSGFTDRHAVATGTTFGRVEHKQVTATTAVAATFTAQGGAGGDDYIALVLVFDEPATGIALYHTATNFGTSGTTIDVTNFTAPTGSVICVDIGGENNVPTGVTYNSVALTQLFNNDLSGVGFVRLARYMAVTGPDGSPHTVQATFGGSISGAMQVLVTAWTGVETSSVAAAHRTIYSGGGGTLDALTVVDSAANDVVFDAVSSWATDIANVEQVVNRLFNQIGGAGIDFGAQFKYATGASTSMDFTGGGNNTHAAYALVPGAAPISDAPETLRVVRSGIRLR